MSELIERIYAVQGMSCAHCKAAIGQEVTRVPGVTDLSIDLETGRMTVRGASFTDDAIVAAVEEAGYEMGST